MSGVLKNMELDLDIRSGQLKYVPSPNFSYNYIPIGCCMIIHQYQEMTVNNRITIQGRLVIEGSLIYLR